MPLLRIFTLFTTLFSLMFQSVSADMRVEQQLTFGNIAIKDNSQPWVMKLLSNGSMSVGNGIIVLEPGQIGKYFFYNLPPLTQVSVSIVDGTGDSEFAGASTQSQFTIQPYLDFPTFNTNTYGEFTLDLPAVLQTSGDGTSYSDGTYFRFFKLSINY